MQQKEVILEGTIKAFNEKGLKFTMDDVAKILGMSKKTIYTVFRDKESMFLAMVDYMFDSIKESEQQSAVSIAVSYFLSTWIRSETTPRIPAFRLFCSMTRRMLLP